MLDGNEAGRLILTVESRVLKRSLGLTAWAVLEDVVLDAVPKEGRWLARTSTRCVADHLGLTPGTVARALARLSTEGIVHREDRRRDVDTGRFGESVYVVEFFAGLRPCVDLPHTADRDMETPHAVRRAVEARHTTVLTEDGRTAHAPGRRPSSSGRRRGAGAPVQLPLLGDDVPTATSAPSNASNPTNTKPQYPKPETPTTHNPKSQSPTTTQPLNPTTERATDTCQLSQARPGRASC